LSYAEALFSQGVPGQLAVTSDIFRCFVSEMALLAAKAETVRAERGGLQLEERFYLVIAPPASLILPLEWVHLLFLPLPRSLHTTWQTLVRLLDGIIHRPPGQQCP